MSTPAPIDQAQYWNEDGGRRWVETIDRVERMIEPLNAVLLALAAPRPGERVLDVRRVRVAAMNNLRWSGAARHRTPATRRTDRRGAVAAAAAPAGATA